MHAYIYIYSIHVHIYMHIYTCIHCMGYTNTTCSHQPTTNDHTHTAPCIHTHTVYIHTHTTLYNLLYALCTTPQNITTPWHQESINQGLYRACTCPASMPFEHASSGRHEHRLTDLAQPRYHCSATPLAYNSIQHLYRP